MKKSQFTESQVVAILQKEEARVPVAQLARKHGISRQTLQRWKPKFGGLRVSEMRRLESLADENRRPMELVGEQALDVHALKGGRRKSILTPPRLVPAWRDLYILL